MNWARILAFVTGMMDKELLTRSEYLVAKNRILKAQLKGRLKLSDAERTALAEIGHRLGRKVLADMICSWPWEARRSMDWDEYFRQQAAMYRKLAEKTEDAFIKQELLDLAAVCEEVANNIEDHQTSG